VQTLGESQPRGRGRLKRFLLTTALVLAGLFIIWRVIFPVYSHGYRLTIEVETPEGLKSAANVINVSAQEQPWPISSVVTHLSADATYLDLGHGKNVVALLSRGEEASQSSAPTLLALETFGLRNCRTSSMCDWSQIERTTGRRDLPPELLPTLVTFTDPKNPRTARVIEPSEFPTVFGAGYRFKGAWIEMTDDRVTRNIKERLPWLEGFAGTTNDGKPKSAQRPPYIYGSHFISG
jgi:hypothetical protein